MTKTSPSRRSKLRFTIKREWRAVEAWSRAACEALQDAVTFVLTGATFHLSWAWWLLCAQARVGWSWVVAPWRLARSITRTIRQGVALFQRVQPLLDTLDPSLFDGLEHVNLGGIVQAMKGLNPNDLAALPDLIAMGRAFVPAPSVVVISSASVSSDPVTVEPPPGPPVWLPELYTQLHLVRQALILVADKLERIS